jgi:ComF family protein
MASAMFDRIYDELPPTDIVLPVPMYSEKEKKRGYNQADVVGRSLAKKLDLPYDDSILRRDRNTGAMSGLKSSERAENIRGAFKVLPHGLDLIRGKRLLLIDDIYTTGSTVNECADVLKAAGALKVNFIVFAVGSDSGHDS